MLVLYTPEAEIRLVSRVSHAHDVEGLSRENDAIRARWLEAHARLPQVGGNLTLRIMLDSV